MNRKAILFTMSSIILISSLLVFGSAYLSRNKGLERTAALSLTGEKLSYAYDDITDEAYQKLLSFNINSITRDTHVTVTMNHTNLTSTNYTLLMQDYKTFIEGTYNQLNNLDITLDGFNNSFTITPYNTTIEIDTNIINAQIDTSLINKIKLVIDTADTTLNTSQAAPADNGDVEVEIEITHTGGTFEETASLDPSLDNDPFYINFASGAKIQIDYDNQVLTINSSQTDSEIPTLELRYDPVPEKVQVKGSNITITTPANNMTKTTRMVIEEE